MKRSRSSSIPWKEVVPTYAELLVDVGLNLKRGQPVLIEYDPQDWEFARLVGKVAYERGARHVELLVRDQLLDLYRLQNLSKRQLKSVSPAMIAAYRSVVDSEGARLGLWSTQRVPELEEIPAEINAASEAARGEALDFYRSKGINRGYIQWCLALLPSTEWARDIGITRRKLEQCLIQFLMLDQLDPAAAWRAHLGALKARRRELEQLKLKELHFTGEGLDLRVGLIPNHLWCDTTGTTRKGRVFVANMPSFEVFTTPDWRTVSGTLRVTCPVIFDGVRVSGINVRLEEGTAVWWSCDEGLETLTTFFDSDPMNKRLGEVALVSLDTPIARSGLLFGETMLDENAGCHVAFGAGYSECLRNGHSLSPKQLSKQGVNSAAGHSDVMISDRTTVVTGIKRDGASVVLIKDGVWTEAFR